MKTYISISTPTLIMSIKTSDGKVHEVKFDGAILFPNKINGQYRTSNKLIQEALESSKQFNRLFALVETAEVEEVKQEEVKEPVNVDDPYKIINDVTTVAAARDFLVNLNDGLTKSFLKNMTVVLAEAEKRGIKFPNLQQ